METRGLASGLGVLLILTAAPSPSGATVIVDNAKVELELINGLKKFVNLAINTLIGVGTEPRGAAVAAAVPTDLEAKAANTSFFGDTGLLTAQVADTKGNASAEARNVLRGKVNKASVKGIGSARSVLTWKGQVVWNAVAPIPLAPLPKPAQVKAAKISINYAIEETDVLVVSQDQSGSAKGAGSYSIQHAWMQTGLAEQLTSFEGSFGYGYGNLLPKATGDLLLFTSDFVTGPGSIIASNLIITDTFDLPIDYGIFFSTCASDTDYSSCEVSADFTGLMIASADVAEPTSLTLLGIGLAGIGYRRQKARKNAFTLS